MQLTNFGQNTTFFHQFSPIILEQFGNNFLEQLRTILEQFGTILY
jgi:hypothetical protein